MNARHRLLLPVIAFALVSVIALAAAGSLFYMRGKIIMEAQLKEKLRSTATAAAMQFDGTKIEKIQLGSTMDNSPELRAVVSKLHQLRQEVANIRYVYIMRKTDEPTHHAFVADADLALTDQELDENGDGIVGDDEAAAEPGELYDWTEFPVLGEEAFIHPAVDEHVGEDKWGPIISGYAPIKDNAGKTVAVLGIDMDANEFRVLATNIFSPIALLLVLLASVSIAGGTVLAFWRRRIEELEKLETERMGLLRLAFHQLGGPLTIISWSIEELEDEGPASIQHAVENIHEGIRRLSVILKTLKDADMVHAGKIDYQPERASLTTILEQVVKESKTKIDLRKQSVRMKLDGDIVMKLDPKLIASVAQELINNAIDFSRDGAVIEVSARHNHTWAEFSVKDFGCGIPKRDQKRIFEEFARASNAGKFKANGNGLGMYIVQGIVKRAGGTVKLQSTEGRGTTVTVRLPQA